MATVDSVLDADTSFQSELQDLGTLRHRLSVSVPIDNLQSLFDDKCSSIAQQAHLKGFRKGHVPSSVIKQKFKREVWYQASQELVDQLLPKAIQEQNLRPITVWDLNLGEPNFERDFEFSVLLEQVSKFDLPDFSAITVEQPVFDVPDEVIESRIQALRANHSELSPVQRMPNEGELIEYQMVAHDVVADMPDASDEVEEDSSEEQEASSDSEEVQDTAASEEEVEESAAESEAKLQNKLDEFEWDRQPTSHMFHGQATLRIEEAIDAAVAELEPGETVDLRLDTTDQKVGTIEAKVSEDNSEATEESERFESQLLPLFGESLNVEGEYRLRLKQVFEGELISETDLIEKEEVSAEDPEALRKEFREAIEAQYQQVTDMAMLYQVREKVLQDLDFVLPKRLVDQQVDNAKAEQQRFMAAIMQARADSPDLQLDDLEELSDDMVQRIKTDVAVAFIADEVVQKNELEVENDDLARALQQQVAQWGEQATEERLEQIYSDENLRQTQLRLVREKAWEYAVQQTSKVDVKLICDNPQRYSDALRKIGEFTRDYPVDELYELKEDEPDVSAVEEDEKEGGFFKGVFKKLTGFWTSKTE